MMGRRRPHRGGNISDSQPLARPLKNLTADLMDRTDVQTSRAPTRGTPRATRDHSTRSPPASTEPTGDDAPPPGDVHD